MHLDHCVVKDSQMLLKRIIHENKRDNIGGYMIIGEFIIRVDKIDWVKKGPTKELIIHYEKEHTEDCFTIILRNKEERDDIFLDLARKIT